MGGVFTNEIYVFEREKDVLEITGVANYPIGLDFFLAPLPELPPPEKLSGFRGKSRRKKGEKGGVDGRHDDGGSMEG